MTIDETKKPKQKNRVLTFVSRSHDTDSLLIPFGIPPSRTQTVQKIIFTYCIFPRLLEVFEPFAEEKLQTPLLWISLLLLLSSSAEWSLCHQAGSSSTSSPPPLSWFLHPWDLRQWPNSLCHAMPWHLKPLGRGTPIFFCLCVGRHTISGPVPWSLYFSSSQERTKLAFIYLLVRDMLASSSLFFCINICDHLIITTDARGMTWVLFNIIYML